MDTSTSTIVHQVTPDQYKASLQEDTPNIYGINDEMHNSNDLHNDIYSNVRSSVHSLNEDLKFETFTPNQKQTQLHFDEDIMLIYKDLFNEVIFI